ncbi:hypothetical protein F9C07_2072960 [Aspergillus flavus]|uniref:Polarized growth protein n=1 Tax=Aspergillus flavus (strain ATCC 200026 / FGSC A1120 / IAM 13836 / NRRL 3357 / JCM 12722 / SRRC 167) TaxID=332952 RepID=A0A7U2MJ32_ASPFN|nr:hypothetical protein AFLA_009472 [Aspergillus flavus NRRL3357]QRD84668.1 hypothetical protein F9C07_2072960 [Aspergillus flavus]
MALATPPRNVHPGDLLLVVHDFEARGPDELNLRRGEKIELVELDDGFGDGWYLGKDLNTGTQGLFPGVYTTAAPKIPIRPQKDTLGPNTLKTDLRNVIGQEIFASPISGESTPQASRRASTSDMSAPDIDDSTAPTPSPKQQQRSSSSPLPTSKMAIDIQKSIRQSIDGHLSGQDSPVMNETLSVIDEHITDLSTPRHSVTASQDSKTVNDSASEYSSTFEHRMSYINGHETDEEEEKQPTEEQVRRWNHLETAKHLRQLGLEAKHCDIFEDQEITGDVLLDMNQDFLFMKEFDFGVMGRRLKTWHKVKAFQEEVKGIPQQQSSRGSSFATPQDERAPSRASHTGPLFPRIPNLRGPNGPTQHPRLVSSTMQSNTGSPLTSQAPVWMDHSRRPSAASVREINHSRRHSSIDTTNRYSGVGDSSPASHHKKSSFDRGWTLNGASGSQRRPGSALGAPNETALPQSVFHVAESNGSDSATAVSDDLDRGYFSGPEGDTRKNRRVLQKRSSTYGSVSTPSSIPDEHFQLKVNKRHSRINSADSIRDAAQMTPPTAKASPPRGRFRSLSTRASDRHGQQSSNPPSAEEKSSGSGFFAAFSLGGKNNEEQSQRSSTLPLQGIKNAGPKFRRAVGLRAMSEAVKGIDTSVAPPSPSKDPESPSTRTGSTTPSTTKSSERHSTDGSGKAVEGGASMPRARTLRSGTKSKKDTSAYTQGLEKKTPKEQMKGCDFSGWMKKKSSNLMTTWKPRLFVLRGRRLSYYYSEDDTEERGLIDITAHRVLRADNDPLIALHATLTGSTASPTSPSGSTADGPSSDKASGSESSLRGSKPVGEGPFFFKLVPPKSGTSRTVQFTKPAIHYFQVDSIQEGRLWMAALMKATIERDMELPVETTNKQKTVSLKEARLMNQRPPALLPTTPATQGTEEKDEHLTTTTEESGLMIQGLGDEQVPTHGDDDEKKRVSSPLGGLGVGPPSLLPESVAKTISEYNTISSANGAAILRFASMFLRRLLSRVLSLLLPLAIASSLYLYFYPVFHGCAFPLPRDDHTGLLSNSFTSALRQHFSPQSAENPAIFRLLVLADPQLEGDSSLPKPEDELSARIQHHWATVKSSVNKTEPRQILTAISTAVDSLASEDIPRAFRAARKRLDLLGNDYYLAHIYRTLHWWSRPTHVTVLGDLIGSQWVTDEEFDRRGRRYWERVFKGGERINDDITATGARNYSGSEGKSTELETLNATHSAWTQRIINIVGNHDVGYSGDASEARIERFERVFGRANWDVRFQLPLEQVDNATAPLSAPPTLHLINLNTLTLDSPALSSDIQSHSYAYINDLISHRLYPVEDRTTFTLLLTHLPLHKKEGICTDGPYFTFHESDDEDGPDDVPRFKEGGLKEQNHLSDHISSSGVLQGIFGMTGDESGPGGGRGRNGLILTGHDHTGCDVVHFVNRTIDTTTAEDSEPRSWKWDAKRYDNAVDNSTPAIREVTLRSMMGEYGGNAGLLSLWFDTTVNEWKYEITMCMAGVQHIWWAVHIVGLLTCILLVGYILAGSGSKPSVTKKIEVGQEKKRN